MVLQLCFRTLIHEVSQNLLMCVNLGPSSELCPDTSDLYSQNEILKLRETPLYFVIILSAAGHQKFGNRTHVTEKKWHELASKPSVTKQINFLMEFKKRTNGTESWDFSAFSIENSLNTKFRHIYCCRPKIWKIKENLSVQGSFIDESYKRNCKLRV